MDRPASVTSAPTSTIRPTIETAVASPRRRCQRSSVRRTGASRIVTSSAMATGTTIVFSAASSHRKPATAAAMSSRRHDQDAAARTLRGTASAPSGEV